MPAAEVPIAERTSRPGMAKNNVAQRRSNQTQKAARKNPHRSFSNL
jgi:hypothetical protein